MPGVLVAVSIPIFNKQLEKSRRAVDIDNARSIRSVLSYAVIDGTIEFTDPTQKVSVVVFVNQEGKEKAVDGGVYRYDKCNEFSPVSGGYDAVGLKINGYGNTGGFKERILPLLQKAGLGHVTCKQKRKADMWYAVAVYSDGHSSYIEGNGTDNFDNQPECYDWNQLSGS